MTVEIPRDLRQDFIPAALWHQRSKPRFWQNLFPRDVQLPHQRSPEPVEGTMRQAYPRRLSRPNFRNDYVNQVAGGNHLLSFAVLQRDAEALLHRHYDFDSVQSHALRSLPRGHTDGSGEPCFRHGVIRVFAPFGRVVNPPEALLGRRFGSDNLAGCDKS